MKDKLGGKIIAEFTELRPKIYSYLIDNGDKNEKAKGTKTRFIKQKNEFEDYKNCSETTQLENKINQPTKKKKK